jgi:hypothetical protein
MMEMRPKVAITSMSVIKRMNTTRISDPSQANQRNKAMRSSADSHPIIHAYCSELY